MTLKSQKYVGQEKLDIFSCILENTREPMELPTRDVEILLLVIDCIYTGTVDLQGLETSVLLLSFSNVCVTWSQARF